jgi:hypothetical protein
MRVRKLLVPTLLAAFAVVSAASAHPDPIPAVLAGDQADLVEADLLDRFSASSDGPRARRRARREAPRPVAVPPQLEAIAQCESGGDPRAIGGGGAYRGKYQFSYATWAAVGGAGDPAQASEAEQDRRAVVLYARSGPGQWPSCGS